VGAVTADLSPLSPKEARVIGTLLEKQLLQPDGSLLTLNSLVTACNQSTNRDPVSSYSAEEVETTVLLLKSRGLARVVHPGAGERSTKYRQIVGDAFGWDDAEQSVMCVLLLRGAQTLNEIRTRTERLHAFASSDAVEACLRALAARPEPHVALVERQPGQKEPRWIQLVERDPEGRAAAAPVARGVTPAERSNDRARIDELEHRVAALEAAFADLTAALGD
jgi:uncharacterized protein